jgi:hypothetical protein
VREGLNEYDYLFVESKQFNESDCSKGSTKAQKDLQQVIAVAYVL